MADFVLRSGRQAITNVSTINIVVYLYANIAVTEVGGELWERELRRLLNSRIFRRGIEIAVVSILSRTRWGGRVTDFWKVCFF